MRRWLVPFLVLIILILCGVVVVQWQQLQTQGAAIKVLAEQNTATAARFTRATEQLKKSREDEAVLADEAEKGREQLGATPASLAAKPAAEDPAAAQRREIAEQKWNKVMRTALRASQPLSYAEFAKNLNLSEDDLNKLYDILTDSDMTGDHKTADAALRALLGEASFQKVDQYRKTLSDRMELKQFREGLGDRMAMQDFQAQGLLHVMAEEKARMPASAQNGPEGNTAEQINQFIQLREAMDERVLARAQSILSPEQLAALKAFQAQMIGIQQNSLLMAPDPKPAGSQP